MDLIKYSVSSCGLPLFSPAFPGERWVSFFSYAKDYLFQIPASLSSTIILPYRRFCTWCLKFTKYSSLRWYTRRSWCWYGSMNSQENSVYADDDVVTSGMLTTKYLTIITSRRERWRKCGSWMYYFMKLCLILSSYKPTWMFSSSNR